MGKIERISFDEAVNLYKNADILEKYKLYKYMHV